METQKAGVQLLHSLIYLNLLLSRLRTRWGSTLTLPDILVRIQPQHMATLGFNSYTP